MQTFRRCKQGLECNFESTEVELIRGLLLQLIELLLDAGMPCANAGVHFEIREEKSECNRTCPCREENEDELLSRLERELNNDIQPLDPDFYNFSDPVLRRLFPSAYDDDPRSNHDFHRFTASSLLDDKVTCAKAMLHDLAACLVEGGKCTIRVNHIAGWLKSLTNLRLALATRLSIAGLDDEDRLSQLPVKNPKSFALDIYQWLGYVQESLLDALE